MDFGQCRFFGQEFRRRRGHDGGVLGQATVPFGHERTSIVVMLEFGHEHPILTVKCNGEQMFGGVFARIEQLLANVVEIGDEIRNGRLRRHRSVLESDAVGNHAVSEDDSDFPALSTGDLPRRSEVGGVFNINQISVLVGGLLENFLIGDHPLNAHIRHGFNHGR